MRDLYIIIGVTVGAIVIGTALYLLTPNSKTSISNALSAASSTVSFTVLEQGTNAGGITDRTNYRITTTADLAELWPMIYGDQDGAPLPDIDFTKYEVLAIFDGSHSTGGYSVKTVSIADADGVRTVTIDHYSPNSACMVSQNQSSPFEIIQVPKTQFSLAHIDQQETTMCQ